MTIASRRLAVAVALLGSLGIARPAHAQPAEETVVLPPVVISAPARLPTAPLPLSRIPGSVQIVPGEAVRESGAASLQDYLTRLPGVTLNDEQGNSAQRDITVRGFQATSVTGVPQGVSVFVDGVRVNEPGVEEVNFDLIPLEDIDHVELIRGPSSLFGRNTLGGAVNIVTRRGTNVREIVPELEGGSFGRQQYRLRLSGAFGPLDYYVSGTYLHEDGWRDVSAVRLGKLFAKVGLHVGGTDATLSFSRAQNRIEEPGSLPLSDLRRDRTLNYTGGDFFAPLLNLATLNVRHEIGEHTVVSVNGFGRTLDTEQFNANAAGDDTRTFNHTTSIGGTVQLDDDRRIFGRDNRLTLGVEYVHHDVAFTAFAEPGGGSPPERDSDVSDDQHAFAVYAQDTLDLVKDILRRGDALVLTAGARWDWLRHQISDRGPFNGRPGASGTSTFSRVSPRFGVNYNLSPAAGFYFTFGQGFRAPAFLELTCASPGAVCPGLQAGVAPDPPLKAVKANHYEIGARLMPMPWLEIDASVYRTDVFDDIFSIAPTGTTGLFFQNVGTTRRQGFEVESRARLARQWGANLSYAYTEATFRDDLQLATARLTPGCAATPCIQPVKAGNDLPLVPRHRINAGIDYDVTPWLTLWLSGAFVGSQRFRGDEENVERKLPPYVVLNGGARVHWKGLTAFVTINNLLDDEHETFGTFGPNAKRPGAPIEPFLTPAPPLHVVGGVGYRF